MISFDTYSFLAFLDLTCHLKDTRMFSSCTVLPDSNEIKLRSSDQEASPSAGKDIVVVLKPS